MQRCVGLGWVTFDTNVEATPGAASSTSSSPSTAAVSDDASAGGDLSTDRTRMPEFRCAGMRLSQAWPVGGRRSREPLGSSSVAEKREALSQNEVSENTWAVVCAGKLSMMVPPATPLSTSTGPGGSPWAACNVRCDGVSLRLTTVVAEADGATQADTLRQNAVPNDQESSAGGPSLDSDEEWSQVALRGAQAVAGRAHLIVTSVRGAATQTGPRDFATNTSQAAGRISSQMVKIVMRSGEQVRQVAAFPWRGFGGGDGEVE